MGQIGGAPPGPLRFRIAGVKQRVDFGDERPNLQRRALGEPTPLAGRHRGDLVAQARQRPQPEAELNPGAGRKDERQKDQAGSEVGCERVARYAQSRQIAGDDDPQPLSSRRDRRDSPFGDEQQFALGTCDLMIVRLAVAEGVVWKRQRRVP